MMMMMMVLNDAQVHFKDFIEKKKEIKIGILIRMGRKERER